MGSPGGGDAQAIALHPTRPEIIYVGAAKGLCKTTQGGQDNWPSTGLAHLGPSLRDVGLNRDMRVLVLGRHERR